MLESAVTEEADLALSVTDAPDPVTVESSLTYQLTVSNDGPSAADDVTLAFTLPAGVDLVSTAGCTEDPTGNPDCTVGALEMGSTHQVQVTVAVRADAPPMLVLQATVSAATNDPAPSNNRAQATTVVEDDVVNPPDAGIDTGVSSDVGVSSDAGGRSRLGSTSRTSCSARCPGARCSCRSSGRGGCR